MPLVLVQVYPIGVISMIDNGRMDDKIIAIPFDDPTYNAYRGIDALPNHIFSEMRHFFSVYKQLEHKDTAVNEVRGQREAIEIVGRAIDSYKETFPQEA
jgi:inorganic pyrophosphatase